MRLNFYFEFPCDDPDAEEVIYHNGSTHLISSVELYRLYKKLNPDIECKAINSWAKLFDGQNGGFIEGSPFLYSYFFLIIENPDTHKFFTISYWDKLKSVVNQAFWDNSNCVEIFAAHGVQDNDLTFESANIQYTPMSVMSLHKEVEDLIPELYKKPKIIPKELFFRGSHYNLRAYLAQDPRFVIKEERVTPAFFIKEIAPFSFNIDVNGAAEISSRSLDIMGLESALIRPKLTIKYHNPLIPDYHFAALKCDKLENWKEVADAYVDRFEDLKKDPDLVRFIAANGRKWYEENATIKAHVDLLYKLIDLNKLNKI